MKRFLRYFPAQFQDYIGSLFYKIPPRFRYSKLFWQNYLFLKESQWWDEKQIEEYQNRQLKQLLIHVYENVSFYRNVFDKLCLKPKDIKDINELNKLPILDKETVRQNRDQLISKIHLKKLEPVHTGGTSSPLNFYYQKKYTEPLTRAFFWRFWNWHNYNFGDKCLIITGKYEANEAIHYDSINKWLYLYNPNFNNIKKYIYLLYQFNPKIIMGYPSLLFLFSFYLREKIKIPNLTKIICFSEKLFDYQKELIMKIFNCDVTDGYSHAERLVFLQKCEINNQYHVIPECGIIELKKTDVNSQTNHYAEIIATGFYNYAFPLIRYRTGDYIVISNEECPCGRKHRLVKEIIGRAGDFILTPSKKLISPTVLEFAIRYVKNIKEFQIVQEDINEINIYVVPDRFYKEENGKKFIKEITSRINEDLHYKIILVDKIIRPKSQKMRLVKSKVAQDFLNKMGVM